VRALGFVVALALLAPTGAAAETVAVLWVLGNADGELLKKVAAETRRSMGQRGKAEGFSVFSRAEIGQAIKQRAKCKPTQAECDVATARSLRADAFVTGNLALSDAGGFTLSLLLRHRTGHRSHGEVIASDEAHLLRVTRKAVAQLTFSAGAPPVAAVLSNEPTTTKRVGPSKKGVEEPVYVASNVQENQPFPPVGDLLLFDNRVQFRSRTDPSSAGFVTLSFDQLDRFYEVDQPLAPGLAFLMKGRNTAVIFLFSSGGREAFLHRLKKTHGAWKKRHGKKRPR
jgi:hypothetical protein